MCGRGLESWNVKSQSHVTCVASLTNGQMTHVHSVVTLNMCPRSHVLTCLSSCDVQICRWKSESPSHQSISLSPDYITSPPLCSPLEQHNQRSHSDLTKIMTTHSLSSAVAQPICCLTANMRLMGLTLISVIATYDSISLLRLELVPRTKDLRSYKRCKLRSFYDEISTCTAINSSFTQTRTAQ